MANVTGICITGMYPDDTDKAIAYIKSKCSFLPALWLTDLDLAEGFPGTTEFKIGGKLVQRNHNWFTIHVETSEWGNENIEEFLAAVRTAPWDNFPLTLHVYDEASDVSTYVEVLVRLRSGTKVNLTTVSTYYGERRAKICNVSDIQKG